MHELLLQAPIPLARYNQVLHILAGLAAMQPQPALEAHYVFKPNRLPSSLPVSRAGQVGAAQDVDKSKSQTQMQAAMASGDLFYMKVVKNLSNVQNLSENGRAVEQAKTEGSAMDVDGELKAPDPQALPTAAAQYMLQFRDLPEPTRNRERAVTSRLMADTPILSGDPGSFMKALDYRHISTYFIDGYRLTHNNISLLLYRVLLPRTESAPSGQLDQEKFDRAQTRLLDPSGNYILQATLRVQDGSKVEITTKGLNELLALNDTLKGVVELEMAERLALDTRVR